MTRLKHLWTPIRHDHRLMRTRPIGQNIMLSYSDEKTRDDAHPNPGDSKLVIYNEALGSEQFWTGKYWRTPTRTIGRDLQAYPQIYVPHCCVDFTAKYWYLFFRSRSQPSVGYYAEIGKGQNIRFIRTFGEGTVCPAWYLGYIADNANLSPTNNDGWWYYNIGSGYYIDYDIPSGAQQGYAATHARVWVYTVSGNSGQGKIVKNPGVDDTTIGTFDTDAATDQFVQRDIVLSETVVSGDTIRIERADGESDNVRVHEVAVYDASGTQPYPPMEYLIQDNTDFTLQSGHELALRLAPAAAGGDQWIGGYHQSATSKETNVTETWKIDGVVWTPAAGVYVARCGGNISLERSSTHEYTDGAYNSGTPGDIGSVETAVTVGATQVEAKWKYTADVDQLVNIFYPAMIAAPTDSNINTGYVNGGTARTIPDGDQSYVNLHGTNRNQAHVMTIGTLSSGDDIHLELLERSHNLSEVFVNPSINYKKGYFKMNPPSDTWASGSEAFAKWRLSFS